MDQALGVGLALRQRLEVVIAACERDLEDDREEIIAAGRYAFAGTLEMCIRDSGLSAPL